MGFPTSFPASFLSDDGGSQRDRHLHLGLGAGREDDGRFLDGALYLVFLRSYNLEDANGERQSVTEQRKACRRCGATAGNTVLLAVWGGAPGCG